MATDPTQGRSVPLAERAKNIIVTPKTEWPRIDAEPATVGSLYRNYVMILAAIPAIAFAVGMLVFGLSWGPISYKPPVGSVIGMAVIQYVSALVSVFVMGLIIDALAPTFGGTRNRVQAVKVAAYSYTPAWVAGILMLLPSLALLAGLISLYGLYLIYLGLPVLMKSPKEKAAGYTAAAVVAAIVLYLVVAMVTAPITAALMPTPPMGSINFG